MLTISARMLYYIHILVGNTLISSFHVGFEIEMPLNNRPHPAQSQYRFIRNIGPQKISRWLSSVSFFFPCRIFNFVYEYWPCLCFFTFSQTSQQNQRILFFKGFDKHQQNVLQNRYQITNLKSMKLPLKYKYLPTYAYVGSVLILFRMIITIRKKTVQFYP